MFLIVAATAQDAQISHNSKFPGVSVNQMMNIKGVCCGASGALPAMNPESRQPERAPVIGLKIFPVGDLPISHAASPSL